MVSVCVWESVGLGATIGAVDMVVSVERGWVGKDDDQREHKVVEQGCLLLATMSGEVTFPQRAVLVCKYIECGAESNHVGELPCKGLRP